MIHRRIFLGFTMLKMCLVLLLVGCRSSAPPVEFYTLNPISASEKKINTAGMPQQLAIGIGPVQIPQILDRPQIVSRTGPNKIKVDEYHRWAGRLDDDFAKVMAENISILLSTDQVAVYPWDAGFNPHYQVAMNVRYFERRWYDEIRLEVIWRVSNPKNKEPLMVKKSVIKKPLTGSGYEALVAAKSQALAMLSTEIADHIRDLQFGAKKGH